MTSLAVALDDDLAEGLQRLARERDAEIGNVVAMALKEAVQREDARKRLRHLADSSPAHLAPDWKWNREDTYDRPMLRAVVAAAERLGAPVLYTEDLNHGQLYGSVLAQNPFRDL